MTARRREETTHRRDRGTHHAAQDARAFGHAALVSGALRRSEIDPFEFMAIVL
ncbi:hypothetical protein H0I76_12875 [Limibaculum sp. M0105]|uniref:Uncharacterized protein n=1 Tax=Thermohalobaculum xanthum TaxID=2753746 RepID=A0A8J7M865_9RHOB|nr:hypothetical protein [Thermohalobaculum xanthum]MBK0400086.1 hypothetical protein [Thermohalobaculum xanthum]